MLTILAGKKLCFTQFSTRMDAWLLLTFFICLHNQLSSIDSIITYRGLENVIHQIDSTNEWLLFQQVLLQNLRWFLSRHWRTLFSEVLF